MQTSHAHTRVFETTLHSSQHRQMHSCWVCGAHPSFTDREDPSDPVPYILQRGRWLATYGFVVGARVLVQVNPGVMTFTVDEAPQPAVSRVPKNFVGRTRAGTRKVARAADGLPEAGI